ncbi:cytochrome c oxidase accessory protein CcoG [Sphingomonas sp. TX0543]|uniref:cytochrome c oxidase accessory protein CcoG n=1 Tax=unclassified Sphingomonas TaxID=196159 RepID=UPI0010F7BDAC|nr:cytochrome c oxidase accessory protein CcoG [Sphingomonas sp. 3P27F8]
MPAADAFENPTPRFFEARRKVFPRRVSGTFRRLKWAIMAVTLLIYYVTPWLRWNRGAFAPSQAVLVDLAHRRFYMFAIEIWPNEFYYVVGLLVMAAVGLFLVTSAVGRAWCGYACPQTVWTDLFVHVERAIEGDRNAQIRLDRAPWGAEKIAKRVAKFLVWLLIAAATGGAWIFYFADAPALAREFMKGSAPFVAYSTVGILTFTTFTLGGLMREQVCIYMCPWPRIQSAMMDEKSLAVTYKHWRGEPRTHGLKRAQAEPGAPAPALVRLAQGEKAGDCIDCGACIAVCPTGIDIREGPQIGCITCGLCIDSCDEIMAKVGREPHLIGYTTEADMRRAAAGEAPVSPLKRLLRMRTIAYFLIWLGVGCGMLFALGTRTHIGMSVLQTRNPLWVRLSDGAIRNTYTVKLSNMEGRARTFVVTLSGIDAALWKEGGARDTAGKSVTITVPADRVAKAQLFVAAPAAGATRSDVRFIATTLDSPPESADDTSYFERPESNR